MNGPAPYLSLISSSAGNMLSIPALPEFSILHFSILHFFILHFSILQFSYRLQPCFPAGKAAAFSRSGCLYQSFISQLPAQPRIAAKKLNQQFIPCLSYHIFSEIAIYSYFIQSVHYIIQLHNLAVVQNDLLRIAPGCMSPDTVVLIKCFFTRILSSGSRHQP